MRIKRIYAHIDEYTELNAVKYSHKCDWR